MMMKIYFFTIAIATAFAAIAQPGPPVAVQANIPVNWGTQTRSAADSCGAYFNNYIGLGKTTSIRVERMRTGNTSEFNEYNGRSQKFSAPQPIEISGIEFYSFIENNALVDSLMVVTILNEYDAVLDSLGAELARDTVYVSHSTFNPLTTPLPAISVQSEFNNSVILSSDYMVSIYTPTDDSLRIIANSLTANDGAGEGLSYALYDNTSYPSFTGWYSMQADFTADYDFIISPKISFIKQTDFILTDTSLCPADQTCITYTPVDIQFVKQYNSDYDSWQDNISIDWADGAVAADTVADCHVYSSGGNYAVSVSDFISIWDFNTPTCDISLTKSVEVKDSIDISFTFTQSNLTADFTTTTNFVDSVWWDFGDNTTGSSDFNPTHTFPGPGSYNVWLYSFNDCMTKSLFTTITIGPSSVDDNLIDNFRLYPNPANQQITLKNIPESSVITIYNIAGKKVYDSNTNNESLTINTSVLNSGTYFVRCESSDNTVTKKITIQH
ncbi:MAG: T9SS type A sorting domain-containing protein [Crocinitomicaceae bacterium]